MSAGGTNTSTTRTRGTRPRETRPRDTSTSTTGTRKSSTRESSGTDAARRKILRSRNRFWRSGEIPGAPSTVQHLLADLTRSGELRRVRKGLYWRGTHTPLGMSPPSSEALAARIAPSKGAGPTGLSAANLLRLSTQVPRRAQIAVPGRAARPTKTIEFVARPSRTRRRTADLSKTEVAVLEMLGDLSTSELAPRETWRRLAEVLRSDTVRPDRLAKAAETEPGTVRVRLAELMNDGGFTSVASSIRPADPRVRERALASIK
jgi:hypothetical protein